MKFIVATLVMSSVGLLCATIVAAQPGSGPAQTMNTEKSVLTLRVYKSGLFSAFAHDHEIHAPIQQGTFDEAWHTVDLQVDARKLQVVDPGVSASERVQVQANMQGPKVLDSEKFPEIKFRSTRVEPAGPDKWTVQGDLTVHGQTHSVKVDVHGAKAHYTGSSVLKQTDFGITPIKIAGGSVKVKDEVRVEFEIFGQ
jgi:hypothetical protein